MSISLSSSSNCTFISNSLTFYCNLPALYAFLPCEFEVEYCFLSGDYYTDKFCGYNIIVFFDPILRNFCSYNSSYALIFYAFWDCYLCFFNYECNFFVILSDSVKFYWSCAVISYKYVFYFLNLSTYVLRVYLSIPFFTNYCIYLMSPKDAFAKFLSRLYPNLPPLECLRIVIKCTVGYEDFAQNYIWFPPLFPYNS